MGIYTVKINLWFTVYTGVGGEYIFLYMMYAQFGWGCTNFLAVRQAKTSKPLPMVGLFRGLFQGFSGIMGGVGGFFYTMMHWRQ